MKNAILRLLNLMLRRFGLTLTSSKNLLLTYQHDYGAGGYDRYRELQIFHNKRKIQSVWADPDTIKFIANYLHAQINEIHGGICHGTRRGFEQAEFHRLLGCEVIGTEISDTASQFPNTVEWDFHVPKAEWLGAFSFVYSNSLDQAFDPKRAVATWVNQLESNGLLFIEHTMMHAAQGASEMDPFGAHPMVMPYLLFEWGRGEYELFDILHPPHKKLGALDIWIFVIRKIRK